MTRKCLDEGIIQAYLDGELGRDEARAAAAHLAACEECAALLASAEQETAFFAAAFAPDAHAAVPTELLRARITAAVAQLEAAPEAPRPRGWSLGALLAPLGGLFNFTPQRAAAFASLLVVVAAAFVFYSVRRQSTQPAASHDEVARVETPAAPVAEVSEPAVEPEKVESTAPVVQPSPAKHARVVNASAPRRAASKRPPASATPAETATQPKAEPLVPGEKNYQEAIASLKKVVEAGGDASLSPKARIEYERNIALLDRAIEETRRVALRNPKNRDAVGFLMSAYQSKVELLSAVADQTQVAAIGR